VGACAAHFGGLVGAFHVRISGKPMIIVEFTNSGKEIAAHGHGSSSIPICNRALVSI
jgi:hypothetical protein